MRFVDFLALSGLQTPFLRPPSYSIE